MLCPSLAQLSISGPCLSLAPVSVPGTDYCALLMYLEQVSVPGRRFLFLALVPGTVLFVGSRDSGNISVSVQMPAQPST